MGVQRYDILSVKTHKLAFMKLYGLIGYPMSHSLSDPYFTKKFEQLGLEDHAYRTFPFVLRISPGFLDWSRTSVA
jgi:shikimate 5-dehydrogenase